MMPDRDSIVDYDGLLGSRAVIVLFGDSLTQRGFEASGWAGKVANHYGRRADVYNRGYGGYNSRWGRSIMGHLFPEFPPTPLTSWPSRRHHTSPREKDDKYFLATIWFGANDASVSGERAHVPLAEYADNMSAMIAHLRLCFLHVLVLTPPPVHAARRLAWTREKGDERADRSTELAGKYAMAAERAVAEYNQNHEQGEGGGGGRVLCLDVWRLMLQQDSEEGEEGGWAQFLHQDGLHLSPLGNHFVSQQLLNLLNKDVGNVEDLPSELPWGSGVDPIHFEASIREHQQMVSADRTGRGLMMLGRCNGRQDRVLLDIGMVVLLCAALFSFVNYFCSFVYFRGSKDS